MPFPLDERWIRLAEDSLARRLPDAYRERMMRDNGGELAADGDVWWLYPICDRSDRKRIKRTCNHILLETQAVRSWAGFPGDGLAIASNGSGDQLVLLPSKQNSEAFAPLVYFWSHETRDLEAIAEFGELAPQQSGAAV